MCKALEMFVFAPTLTIKGATGTIFYTLTVCYLNELFIQKLSHLLTLITN